MRIAFVGPFGLEPKGSVKVRALPLARALVRRGHEVGLLIPPFHNSAAGRRRWEDEGVLVEEVTVSRLPLVGYGLTARRLARGALGWQPEVIHCFKPKGYSGLAHWLLARWRTFGGSHKLVVDSDDWEGWGGWNELEPYPIWQKPVFAWQERWGLTHADMVTVASRALQTIVWSLGPDPERVLYLPNGPGIAPTSQGTVPDQPVILLYTRFFEFSVERVIALLGLVRHKVAGARLLVVGKGLYGEEQELIALAAEADLADAVEYAGWLPPEDLPRRFQEAQCAIVPMDDTLINRTKCSVKLADLLASGVPVVAENVGQSAAYINEGQSGLLVPPGDDQSFAKAVIRLLEQPDLRTRLADGARKRIAAEFSWDRSAGELERAYRALFC